MTEQSRNRDQCRQRGLKHACIHTYTKTHTHTHTRTQRETGAVGEPAVPDSSSARGVRTESGRRGCTGWISTGALLALRINAADNRLSPVERLRNATTHQRKRGKGERQRGTEWWRKWETKTRAKRKERKKHVRQCKERQRECSEYYGGGGWWSEGGKTR